MVLVIAALQIATQLRIHIPLGMQLASAAAEVWQLPLPVYLLASALWIIMFNIFDVYIVVSIQTLARELQRITLISVVSWLIFTGLLYLTYRDISRLQIIYFLGLYLLLVWVHRLSIRLLYMRYRWLEHRRRNILVIGTSKASEALTQIIKNFSWAGYHLVGYVAPRALAQSPSVLGTLDNLPEIIEKYHVHEVVIASLEPQQEILNLVQQLQLLAVNIRIAPDYFDMAFLDLKTEDFGGVPLITLKAPVLTPFQIVIKRIFDIVLTSLLLIPTLPLLVLIAIAIRLDSAGPAIFKQERIKQGGKIFVMYKFRTMYYNPQAHDESLQKNDISEILHKHPDDPRVTRVGRFLRRTSLDELPQLINVLKGDMSLVGPRPEMPWLVEKYEVWQRKRFAVPQGMTGWWQVNGRAERLMHLNIDQDLYYIRNYSIWMDIKILWLTLGAVISGRGAF